MSPTGIVGFALDPGDVATDQADGEIAEAEHLPMIVAAVIVADGGTLDIAEPTGTGEYVTDVIVQPGTAVQ